MARCAPHVRTMALRARHAAARAHFGIRAPPFSEAERQQLWECVRDRGVASHQQQAPAGVTADALAAQWLRHLSETDLSSAERALRAVLRPRLEQLGLPPTQAPSPPPDRQQLRALARAQLATAQAQTTALLQGTPVPPVPDLEGSPGASPSVMASSRAWSNAARTPRTSPSSTAASRASATASRR